MSEPKLISPLLDGFAIGTPMSDHDGVCCCPAMKENSDKKYIVKMISIPASQVQLDALLLTGAYKDPADAMDYFKEVSDSVVHEAECLKKLSKLEGFLPYEGWQVVPMDIHNLGYEVYLLGSYKRSLEKFLRRNPMTYLGAVNLGLDMCAALSSARRAGWMYVDLKPSNIFFSEGNEYRIGDLGFMELSSLKYSSLPSKYQSVYTAPEMKDAMATPNETLDTYALGMILYQIYNDGQLPQVAHPGEDVLPAPANADYEMAEIILRACAPDPKDRWPDPIEMGQALVAYMQRNTINDTPIMPPMLETPVAVGITSKKKRLDETLPGAEDVDTSIQEGMSEEMNAILDQADDLISHEAPTPAVAPETPSIEEIDAAVQTAMAEEKEAEAGSQEADSITTPEPEEISEEIATDAAEEEGEEDEIPDYVDMDILRKRARRKRFFKRLVLLLLLVALAAGGYWGYENYYLVPVNSMRVEGTKDTMVVTVDAQIDDSQLQVVCTDTYGNTKTEPVKDGKAVFVELLPDMGYRVQLQVAGLHKLEGTTSQDYMTPARTNLVDFTAATGPEDGSVMLKFTLDGPSSNEWIVTYGTEGEEDRTETFSDTTVTIYGLTVGKNYTFRLQSAQDLYLVGNDTIDFQASKIVIAQNLVVNSDGETLTITWEAPEDTQVESWDIHCYSSDGYDERITTADLTATFPGISTGSAYTVEVTAAGMTQPARANITANPLTITAINVDESNPEKLTVSWEFEGTAPVGGWLLTYTLDNNARQEIVQADSNCAVIDLRIPGAVYNLIIQAADASTVFGNTYAYQCPDAPLFENKTLAIYARSIENLLYVHLLPTPEKENWSYKDITSAWYATSFASGQDISVLLYLTCDFYLPRTNMDILYVIRDAEGNVISDLVVKQERIWYDMWWNTNYHYCELDIPAVPTEAGDYTVSIYFDGMTITTQNFTITE